MYIVTHNICCGLEVCLFSYKYRYIFFHPFPHSLPLPFLSFSLFLSLFLSSSFFLSLFLSLPSQSHSLTPQPFLSLKHSSSSSSSSLSLPSSSPSSSSSSSLLPLYRGTPLCDISFGPSSFPLLPPLSSSSSHTVLVRTPLPPMGPPLPCPAVFRDVWDNSHVRMPCSQHNLYPITTATGERKLVGRWALIRTALSRGISSSRDLEEIIMGYNSRQVRRCGVCEVVWCVCEVVWCGVYVR